MEELKQTELKSAFKPMNNDAAMLATLIGELNGDRKIPPQTAPPYTPEQMKQLKTKPMTTEEIAANEIIMQAELAKAESVENIPHSAQVEAAKNRPVEARIHEVRSTPQPLEAPVSPIERPARLFVTGHPGAIDRLLENLPGNSRLVSLAVTVLESLKATCELKGNPPAATVAEFRRFGDGEYVPSLQNLFIMGLVRKSFPEFASPGFWARLILNEGFPSPGPEPASQLVVVSIRTSSEFKALQEAGFKHFHVMASPGTVQRRTPKDYAGALTQLSQALDSDTHKKISAQRQGQRLNVVWNDESVSPSSRFISAKEFQESVLGAAPTVVGSDSLSQIL